MTPCSKIAMVLVALSSIVFAGCGSSNPPESNEKVAAKTILMPGTQGRSMPPAPARVAAEERKALEEPALKLPKTMSANTSKVELPSPDNAEIEAVKKKNGRKGEKQFQLGFGRQIPPALRQHFKSSQLTWVALPDGGQAARVSVTSPNAIALRLALNITRMPNGIEMRFFGSANPSRIYGPVTASKLTIGAVYWTPVIDGDTLTMEIFLPKGAAREDFDLDVSQVSHLVLSPVSSIKTNGLLKSAEFCEIDIACAADSSEALKNVAASVAKMTFTESDGNSYACSGTMLNGGETDAPFFYSGSHCISDQATASTLNTYWFYERAYCGGPLKQMVQLTSGARFLYNDAVNDSLLLVLNDAAPTGSVYAGWDANPIVAGSVTGLHHPAGDIKKVSVGSTTAIFTPFIDSGSQIPVTWSQGVTEPGSSGSGLFTSDGTYYYLRGGLHGGSSTCDDPSGTDLYSRLDLAYPSIQKYLYPTALPRAGWWWNPAEGGRGFTLEVFGNKVFFAGYLYDADGRANWYVSGPTEMASSSRYSGTLAKYVNGQTLTGDYKPASLVAGSQGNISVDFSDASHGMLTWPGGTIPIQRYDIVPGGAGATPPAGTPEAGWWWSEAEGGRGYSIEIQNGTMFMAGYMYDTAGNPIWYASGPTAMTNATTYDGTWLQYGNGQTLTGTYKAANIVNSNVGTIKISFSDSRHGTLTLPNLKQIAITRFMF